MERYILSYILPLGSLVLAFVVALSNSKKSTVSDARKQSAETASIMSELKYISNGITEIKTEIKNIKDETQELRDRLIKVEQSYKSAHHRMDGIAAFLYSKYGEEAKIRMED